MDGPVILAESLRIPLVADSDGELWQYHSQSDRHSKVSCWGLVFDLLHTSRTFRTQFEEGKIVFGINRKLVDFRTHRSKNLDLVIGRPAEWHLKRRPRTLAQQSAAWKIALTDPQREALALFGDVVEGNIDGVCMALEAKACMTAHTKSIPRFFDELNSAHETVHGCSDQAIAVGLAVVNASDRFVSSVTNESTPTGEQRVVNRNPQPGELHKTLAKVHELPRRTRSGDVGYDAIGVIVLDFANDGGPVELVSGPPAPLTGDPHNYDSMVIRLGNEYDARWGHI
jgi:hypothetical protein